MTFRIQEPLVHDHTDRELVLIGKLALARHLSESRSTATVGGAAFALLGIAVILLGTVFLAGEYRDIGPMSGQAIGAFVLGLGIAGILLGIHLMVTWLDRRDEHSPDAVIERLTTAEPRRLQDISTAVHRQKRPVSRVSQK